MSEIIWIFLIFIHLMSTFSLLTFFDNFNFLSVLYFLKMSSIFVASEVKVLNCLYQKNICYSLTHLHQLLGSVQPKFGIGAEFRPKVSVSVSVSEPKFFFPKPKLFFSNIFKFNQIFSCISA